AKSGTRDASSVIRENGTDASRITHHASRGEIQSPVPATKMTPPNGQMRAEAYVLRALMTRAEWVAELRGRITPEQFLDAGHRRLAQAVLGNNTNEVFEPRQLDGNDELTQLASALLVED